MFSKDRLLEAKILIVDDQPANVMLLDQTLKDKKYKNVRSTTDSRQAIPIYEEFRPDLLLLDLAMPHMSGFDIMEKLHEIEGDSYIPVLVLTAQHDNKTRLQALKSGARDFITKPFDLMEVLMRINNMLEIRLLHNRLRQQNQELERKVQERTHELEETRMEVIIRLGRAAEYRDNETGMHVVRMSHYSESLGRMAGLDSRECSLLRAASPMHDLGKIGIPDSILLKPGKLDDNEWEIMKMHPTIGASVLAGSDHEVMLMAETISFTHHEKWDGSGYPRGLKGNEIPMVGQIVAVCDVFDALTTERPYKGAWLVEDAVNLIKEQSGRHFNPDLVEKFLQILPEILEIKDQYAESVSHDNQRDLKSVLE
jgi:putative two-component system response regulator